MEHSFEFDVIANSGQISVEREIDLPFSIRINRLETQTIGNCNDRNHEIDVTLNNTQILNTLIKDCVKLVYDEPVTVERGLFTIKMNVNNFDNEEVVKGQGTVTYDILLLPFTEPNNPLSLKDVLKLDNLRFKS